jgi:hypothetical protein
MSIKIPVEYENSFDFGFTATDNDGSVAPLPVVSTQTIIQPVSDNIIALTEMMNNVTTKIDNLQDLILAGANTQNFDVDEYRALVEKEVKEKLKTLEGLVVPLLVNLMKNSDKDYIKWPNRKPVIEAQIQKILSLTRD